MNKDSSSARIILSVFFFTGLFIFLVARLYFVQIYRHDELYGKAKRVYTCVKEQRGDRGAILDINGSMLVGNIPCMDIVADPKYVGNDEKCREIALFFSKQVHVRATEIFRKLSDKKHGDKELRYTVIKKGVNFDFAKKLERVVKKKKYKGINFVVNSKRYYPKNEVLANVLGFTNGDQDNTVPVIGVEKTCNAEFTPTEVKTVYERDRKGMPFSYGNQKLGEGMDGNNIYLTISEPIQTIMEEELDELVKKYNPAAAYAIMVQPETGNIMAMAQRPSFNPNNRREMDPSAWRDRIISDVFEPGSTMKAFTISGALDYGVVSPGTSFDCERGRWFYGGKTLRDAHTYGILNVTQIIQVSSNIGTAKISVMMGKDKLYQTFRRFGFGKKTGIPIQPEATGILRLPKRWDSLSVARFCIGQGLACSPLQLVRAYAAIANGGRLVNLRLIDREMNPQTGEVVSKEPETSNNVFLRPDTRDKIVDMLKLVTQKGGTAEGAAVKGYEVAGKTGTSQKWVDNAYSSTKFNATFVGFVPADNPAFVLLVMADEPKGCHYGGVVSAPAFSRIAEKTLKYLNVEPKFAADEKPNESKKESAAKNVKKQISSAGGH